MEYANPLKRLLGTKELDELMDEVLNHPPIRRPAAQKGYEIEQLTGEIFEKLVQRKPSKRISCLKKWLFVNTRDQIKQIAPTDLESRIIQIDTEGYCDD